MGDGYGVEVDLRVRVSLVVVSTLEISGWVVEFVSVLHVSLSCARLGSLRRHVGISSARVSATSEEVSKATKDTREKNIANLLVQVSERSAVDRNRQLASLEANLIRPSVSHWDIIQVNEYQLTSCTCSLDTDRHMTI